jgi:hypothetical protein
MREASTASSLASASIAARVSVTIFPMSDHFGYRR